MKEIILEYSRSHKFTGFLGEQKADDCFFINKSILVDNGKN